MPDVIETDNRLITAMQAGDESALGAVIDRYTAYAGTIVWNIVRGRLSEADAKEILSDVFFVLWKNRAKLQPGKLRPYLSSIARSRALDALRRTRQDLPLDDFAGISAPGPEERFAEAEEHAALQTALDSLPEPDHTIFIRHYYCCQTTGEIAEKMGLNVNTIQAKLRRGRKTLRKILLKGGCFIEKEDSGAS